MTIYRTAAWFAALVGLAGACAAGDKAPLSHSAVAVELDKQLDWSAASLIAVQESNRYKTLDSMAREAFSSMYGAESLPGLSPMASLMEWLFNRDAYADEAVVRIKDKGLRIHFSTHLPPAERDFIVRTGYMTPRQLADERVQKRMAELEPRFEMKTAMNRVRFAEGYATSLPLMLGVVPATQPDPTAPWHTMEEVIANLPADLRAAYEQTPEYARYAGRPAIGGLSEAAATQLFSAWVQLGDAWRSGNAGVVQAQLDRLAALLPSVAGEGVYPRESQRAAERRYYANGKFTYGWMIYFVGMLVSVFALVTGWRTPWIIALVIVFAAAGLHLYGLSLRWYILGRIPIANMFEAIVGSAWMGIVVVLLLELIFKMRVFVLAAAAAGFFALMTAQYILPGGGTITSIMGILDDVMLRIHTVMIIGSYALVFVASVIAVVYLFGYYLHTSAEHSALLGLTAAIVGAILWVAVGTLFVESHGIVEGLVKRSGVSLMFWIASGAALAAIVSLSWVKAPGPFIASTGLALVAFTAIAIGSADFVRGLGMTMLGVGLTWAASTGFALLLRGQFGPRAALAPAGAGASGAPLAALELQPVLQMARKPIMAGGLPGDEGRSSKLPAWLQTIDWCHLILLNMVFVTLFVGTILGAVWADYSWGRPWGWDPKEVFALNTWLVYLVLIHTRFIVKDRGIWTAWLSVAGCLMMVFNWAFVNFFIVGLHSYA